MRLVIGRSQNKGMMGGVSFQVTARAELTHEERQLVEHYNMREEVLCSRPAVNMFGQPTDTVIEVRVGQLVNGESFKCKKLWEVLAYTESLKEACGQLKIYLEIAASFGGTETIDFP